MRTVIRLGIYRAPAWEVRGAPFAPCTVLVVDLDPLTKCTARPLKVNVPLDRANGFRVPAWHNQSERGRRTYAAAAAALLAWCRPLQRGTWRFGVYGVQLACLGAPHRPCALSRSTTRLTVAPCRHLVGKGIAQGALIALHAVIGLGGRAHVAWA